MSTTSSCRPFSGPGCERTTCLRCAWIKYIREHPQKFWHQKGEPSGGWTWFLSLTLRDDATPERLHQKFRHYCYMLAAHLKCHVLVAFAIGRQPHSGLPHVHAVMSIPEGHVPPTGYGEELWRWEGHPAGDARVEEYNPREGGVGYIVDHGVTEARVACPQHRACHRNGECKFAGALSWPRDGYRGLGDDI